MIQELPRLHPLHPAAEKSWIPPWALIAGQLSHGASWLLLFALAIEGSLGFSFNGLAWVHLVALGWLTLISLAVLLHVLKGFLDLDWKAEGVSRWALLPFALSTCALVSCFWTGFLPGLAWAGAGLLASLAGYLAPAAVSLILHKPADAPEQAMRRAFGLVLGLLALTAAAGMALAWALPGGGPAWLLGAGAAIHAHLGAIGWLSILVLGVSVRTVRPITGDRSPVPMLHILASSALMLGLIALALGLGLGAGPLALLGGAACLAGALAYAGDMGLVLARATVPHRPPQAFLAVSSLYFVAAAVLGLLVLLGHGALAPAYAFVGLMGWLGQMVNGHLHHIGVRVLATLARGEDDETRPQELLKAPLSWGAWACSQLAVLAVTAGLVAGQATWVELGAVAGLAGWALMVANVRGAWRRARS